MVAFLGVAVGCVDDVPVVSGSGDVFVCTDKYGVSAKLCWNGSSDELSRQTTWTCSRARDLESETLGCSYECPTSVDAEWWSWCPADEP